MDNATDDLGFALCAIGAEVLCFALVAYKFATTLGAMGDILEGLAICGALREFYFCNLGYNLAALLNVDHVAKAYVEGSNLVGIVY